METSEWFKEIFKKRKKVHRMFDLINCSKRWSFFDEDADPNVDMRQYKNLVLYDSIFTNK